MKFRKGDEIIVTLGKDKGKKGKIEKVFPGIQEVLIPGMNLYKKHMKRRDEKNPGGIIDFPRPLSVSKISLVCPKCKKPTRIGYQVNKGEKHRICRKCKQLI